MAAIKQTVAAAALASEQLRNDRDFVFDVVRENGLGLQHFPQFQADEEVVLASLHRSAGALQFASPELRADPAIVRYALHSREQAAKALQFADASLQSDAGFVHRTVQLCGAALKFAAATLQGDREIVAEAVRQDARALRYASPALQRSAAFVRTCVAANPACLLRAHDKHRGDREIVAEAVRQDPRALGYATKRLRSDRAVVVDAIQQGPAALLFAEKALGSELIAEDGALLQHAHPSLADDRAVVLSAVKQNGLALTFASRKLRGDSEIVTQACMQNGLALEHCSSASLLDDGRVVRVAVQQNGRALRFASAEKRSKKDVREEAAVGLLAIGSGLPFDQRCQHLHEALQLQRPRGTQVVAVRRECIVPDLSRAFAHGLHRGRVHMRFDGENGFGDGLLAETLSLTAQALSDPNLGVWEAVEDGRVHPMRTTFSPELCEHFKTCGRLTGLALREGRTFPLRYSPALLAKAFHVRPSLEHLASVDPAMHRSFVKLRSCSPEEIESFGCVWHVDEERPAKRRKVSQVELGVESRDEPVTAGNLEAYIQVYMRYRLFDCVDRQVYAFLDGLEEVLPEAVREAMGRCFSLEEVGLLIAGPRTIDVGDWMRHTRYLGCSPAELVIFWFWAIVRELSEEDRRLVVRFATGQTGPPAGGFHAFMGYGSKMHYFTIQVVDDGELPRATTCFNSLKLPRTILTAEILRERLLAVCSNPYAAGFDENAA